MFRKLTFIVTNLFLLLNSFHTDAIELNVEFSADAIQIASGRVSMYSKMYVSKNAVRMDTEKQGQHIVDISYPKEGRKVRLFPQQKTYVEKIGPAISVFGSENLAKTPCEGMPKSKCQRIGVEMLRNIKVDKWQLERVVNGKVFRSQHWIDNNRRLAIKEMFTDGSVTELIMMGKGKLDGRNVEHWESRYSHPSGYKSVSHQWYDLELKMVIREEKKNGFIREINNIKIGKQKSDLFVLPAGYKKISKGDSSLTNKFNMSQDRK